METEQLNVCGTNAELRVVVANKLYPPSIFTAGRLKRLFCVGS